MILSEGKAPAPFTGAGAICCIWAYTLPAGAASVTRSGASARAYAVVEAMKSIGSSEQTRAPTEALGKQAAHWQVWQVADK